MPTPLLLALFVAQFSGASEDPHFSCGPFLLQPGPRTMTIVVDNETAVPARLSYWPTDGESERLQEQREAARHHVFILANLAPATSYTYEITSDTLGTGVHQFSTLPEEPDRYRVLVVGDVRTQPEIWGQLSERMFEHERGALFAIGTGDYPSDGRQYGRWIREFFTPARSFLGHMPLWPAIGNHEATRRHDDVTNIENSHYFSLFELPGNERWYRVDYQLMTLLVLDSNSRMLPGMPQYDWLRAQLRTPRNRFTLVALHHAPHTSGPHGSLRSDGTPAEWPIDEGRRFLVPLFEMYDVDLVLAGHDHIYERSEKDGVVYIVTGGGGAPLYKIDSVENPHQVVAISTHHYVALDIDANGIQMTAIDWEGEVIDSALIPQTERHIARRTRSVTQALDRGTVIGPLDPSTRTSTVTVSNPLDHPLTVKISSAGEPEQLRPLEATLAPGEQREMSLHIGDVWGDLVAEPWRAAVVLDLKLHFEGRDQALEVDVDLAREATVYRPYYDTQRLDSVVLDGALAEWRGVPAMLADERTPLVKFPESYEGPEDFGAQVRLAWSEGWLHLSVDITDEAVVDDLTTAIDQNDCVRVLFHTRPAPSKSVAVYSFGASGRAESSADVTLIRHVAVASDGGWILEASFPLSALGLSEEVGKDAELSCDFLFVDRDVEGEAARPSYHRFWTASCLLSDTSTFGILRLKD